VVDYCIRNAGDLAQVDVLHSNCLIEARRFAESLALPFVSESFALPTHDFEAEYEVRFERICNDVREAQQSVQPDRREDAAPG
jgi:hypothetical protein